MFLLISMMMLIIVWKGQEEGFLPPSVLGKKGVKENFLLLLKVEDYVVKQ